MIRVYFNRKREAPQVWSVDDGDQANEVNVQWVSILVPCRTVYNAQPVNDNNPSAWLECDGVMELGLGGVVIRPSRAQEGRP